MNRRGLFRLLAGIASFLSLKSVAGASACKSSVLINGIEIPTRIFYGAQMVKRDDLKKQFTRQYDCLVFMESTMCFEGEDYLLSEYAKDIMDSEWVQLVHRDDDYNDWLLFGSDAALRNASRYFNIPVSLDNDVKMIHIGALSVRQYQDFRSLLSSEVDNGLTHFCQRY